MRILVINWQDLRNPLSGGAEVHLHEIFSRIAARGHEVTLLCSGFPGAPPEEIIDGIRVIRRGGRNWFNLAVPLVYHTELARRGFDIVVDDLNKIPFFTPLFVRSPLIAIAHHLFDRSIFLEAPWPAAAYVYRTERMALDLYRRRGIPFIVVSPSTQAEFLRKGYALEDLPIVYNCVDHRLYRPTGVARSSVPLVGYFGRLKRYKSVDHLLRALMIARESVPDLRGIIIGEGDDRARLEACARDLGLAGCVTFTGYVSVARTVELLQEMWTMVMPSSKEGWGLTVLEANACGTPVIASDVPGLRDAVRDGETGVLVPYGDVAALAAQMVRMVRDSGYRARLGAAATAWSQKFTWDDEAAKALHILEERANLPVTREPA
jgi:glycosyltransferase involved in cell wall biosynthesis